jgi:hypothetical protein
VSLRPFFTYYGGKWRGAPAYPGPRYRTIIEPFAGSAGYSLRHPSLDVVLIEKSEPLAAIWSYLINASPAEILALPDLPTGCSVDDLSLSQEARWFIGMWLNAGASGPRKHQTAWAERDPWHHKMCAWGPHVRRRVARQVGHIRHWRIVHGDYTDAPDVSATWYVDPPYQGMGKHYPHGADAIDFGALGAWCRSRLGQVMVCENVGATWLPFRFLAKTKANNVNSTGVSDEVIWTNEPARQGVLFA